MNDSGVFEDFDVDLDCVSPKPVEFSSSDDFRKVMDEMCFAKERPSKTLDRWARFKSSLKEITDDEKSLFPSVSERSSGFTSTRRSRTPRERARISKQISSDSFFNECSTPARKMSSQSFVDPDDQLEDAEEKQQKLKEASAKGWHALRRFVDDMKFQRHTSQAATRWAMIRQHLHNMTDVEATRKGLYERYGVIPRLNTDGTYTTSNMMLSPRARMGKSKNKASLTVAFASYP